MFMNFMVFVPLSLLILSTSLFILYVQTDLLINKKHAFNYQIEDILNSNPDLLTSDNFFKNVDKQLQSLKIGIRLTKNDVVLYMIDPFPRPREDNVAINLQTHTFYFSDGSIGKIMLFSPLTFAERFTTHFPAIVSVFTGFLILFNGVFSFYVSRTFIRTSFLMKGTDHDYESR